MDMKVLASERKASLAWVCRAIVASGFVQMVPHTFSHALGEECSPLGELTA